MEKTKFYELSQNNTGGSFDVDETLCHRLIIEADTYEEAVAKAEDLGCYWDEGLNFYPYWRRGYKNPLKKISFQKVREYRTWKYNRKTQWK